MTALQFTIPGEAQPWRRAQLRNGTHFKDKRTKANQAAWAFAAHQALDGRPPMTGALAAVIHARFVPPASASKKRREAMLSGAERPTKRPDLDNIIKNLDGLNGIAFGDDAQVVSIVARKLYHVSAGVDVTIAPVAGAE